MDIVSYESTENGVIFTKFSELVLVKYIGAKSSFSTPIYRYIYIIL